MLATFLGESGKGMAKLPIWGHKWFFLTGNMKLIAVVFSPSGSNWGDRELLGSNTSSSPRYSRWNHTSIPPFPNLCAGHCFSQLPRVGCQLWCFFLLETAAQPEKCWNRISGMPPKQRIIEAHQNPISISNLCSHGAISLTNPCGLPFPHLLRRPPAQRRQTLQPADGSTKETGVGMVRLYLEDLEKATAFEASEGDLSMFRKESKRWKGDCFLPNVRESAHFFVSLVGACTPLQCLQDCWLPRFATVLHEFHCLSSVCIPKTDQSNDPSLKMSGCLRKIHMSVDISRNKKPQQIQSLNPPASLTSGWVRDLTEKSPTRGIWCSKSAGKKKQRPVRTVVKILGVTSSLLPSGNLT